MKVIYSVAISVISASVLCGCASDPKAQTEEKKELVYTTGSNIPKKEKDSSVTTASGSAAAAEIRNRTEALPSSVGR